MPANLEILETERVNLLMPTIYDNQNASMLAELRNTLDDSYKSDFCVGYFNLRGWQILAPNVECFAGGQNAQARVIVGMNLSPDEELRAALRLKQTPDEMDSASVVRLRKTLLDGFRRQLTFGFPTSGDKTALLTLKSQLEARKVAVKLHAAFPLHAKLYLCHRHDKKTPVVGYLGSSNLTFSGLLKQGELNIDVLEQDAALKLCEWFKARWDDGWSLDISDDLAKVLGESWVTPRSPYEIYLKMVYHLSEGARADGDKFDLPHPFDTQLFDYQAAAVKMVVRGLNKRGGVILGDVVGLGKTVMASAVAKVFTSPPNHLEVLVLCPASLVEMWRGAQREFGVPLEVISFDTFINKTPDAAYRLVIIDESHNLRSGEGTRYKTIEKYLKEKGSKVLMLSATPYNKTFLDLSKQLRLFIEPDKSLGIRPEALFRSVDPIPFCSKHQIAPDSLGAFERSDFPDDWRELMRLYLVRRTRSFIRDIYAIPDEHGKKYLLYPNGDRFYFPARLARKVEFTLNEKDKRDQYARLYAAPVVDAINSLHLPRYGLGQYAHPKPKHPPSPAEAEQLEKLGRAGKRLMGFCRTNLFKRLESSGEAFLLSIERHIARNHVFLHALKHNLPLPIGTQNSGLIDDAPEDVDFAADTPELDAALSKNAQATYDAYALKPKAYRWIRDDLFLPDLADHLIQDNDRLAAILKTAGAWDADRDAKLARLIELLTVQHPNQKALIFSQFADTVHFLERELRARGISALGAATGQSADPTEMARRFSPLSNKFKPKDGQELRVLLATDVLSEGQNLQDAHIIVNFDLPWAIIRLIQRAGRVDRIGQTAPEILCYSFLPAKGVEKIINLRSRLLQRLSENAEVVGTDENFFEDEADKVLLELYHEKADLSGDSGEGEVDLPSRALAIWNAAIAAHPPLKNIIKALPDVVNSAKASGAHSSPRGTLVYARVGEENDSLLYLDERGEVVTTGLWTILQAAQCAFDTPTLEIAPAHHDHVKIALDVMTQSQEAGATGLGRTTGARYKAYHIAKRHALTLRGGLGLDADLERIATLMSQKKFRDSAASQINAQLRLGASDSALCNLLVMLHADGALFPNDTDDSDTEEPRILCSMSLL